MNIFQENDYSDRKDFIECLALRYNYKLDIDYIRSIASVYSDEECVNGELESLVVDIIDLNASTRELEQLLKNENSTL